ncbi:MAG: aminotransferase class III-fold pyridoxal phosphate-dependent enzyme, partial [Clostridiales bacterium]|nr:aminotransferase class III-fold pyridoxal phosphate-dependent enzyme [Clostridiales bacterium]
LPGVNSVSGRGLMLGLDTKQAAGDVMKTCLEQGLIVLTAKEKIRLLPPLNITYEELDEAIAILKEVLA